MIIMIIMIIITIMIIIIIIIIITIIIIIVAKTNRLYDDVVVKLPIIIQVEATVMENYHIIITCVGTRRRRI